MEYTGALIRQHDTWLCTSILEALQQCYANKAAGNSLSPDQEVATVPETQSLP